MAGKRRIDWGICDGDSGHTGQLLTAFVHHPTLEIVWLCAECTLNAAEALQNGQVPGLLEAKIKDVFTREGEDY